MADTPSSPPSILFQGLSLEGDQTPSEQGGSNNPRWAVGSSFSPPQFGFSSSHPSHGAFVFGETLSNRSVSSNNVFSFGSTDPISPPSSSSTQVEPFPFRGFAPLRPRTPQQQEKTFQLQSPLTTPPARTTRQTTENDTEAPSFSFLSPSTPDNRPRSSPVLSSTQESPNSTYVASPTPEPPAPVTPYDAKEEAAPPHVLFSDIFQDAMKQGVGMAQKATAAIEKMQTCASEEADSGVGKFLDDAKDLQRFQGTDTRTIAVLGDSGEGEIHLKIAFIPATDAICII